jgi:hypothetical protein
MSATTGDEGWAWLNANYCGLVAGLLAWLREAVHSPENNGMEGYIVLVTQSEPWQISPLRHR